jgi:hypothetical protein
MPTTLTPAARSKVTMIARMSRGEELDGLRASAGTIIRVVAVLIVLILGALVEVAAESAMDPQYWVSTAAQLVSP